MERINKPAPLLKPEAVSVDFEAANFFVEHLEAGPCSDCPSYLSNLGRAYLALRAELAAKDEKLRGLDYLYGELGNQNSFLRAELAEARAEIERLGGLTNLHTVQLSEGSAELAAEKAAREKAEAERDELALLTVPSDEDAQVAVRLRIAEARVESLETMLVRYAETLMPDAHEWTDDLRKEMEQEGRAILAARSAKGGAK